jgi:V/A-type H+-transporting ATPase subunit K
MIMKRRVGILLVFVLLFLSAFLFGEETAEEAAGGGSVKTETTAIWKYFAAAAAVGFSCIAGGIAVGQIGAAAMGAMSENPELSGKALPYAGLAEGICLWGFLVALLILIL